MTIVAGGLSFLTTLATIIANIYIVLPFFFLLAATASIAFCQVSSMAG